MKILAYCLMTNHVHLIAETGENIEVVEMLIRRPTGRHTRYINSLGQLPGALWDGRYKTSPIKTEHYLRACSEYVDLNPVRAVMVLSPGDCPWSSYLSNTGARKKWLGEDPP